MKNELRKTYLEIRQNIRNKATKNKLIYEKVIKDEKRKLF